MQTTQQLTQAIQLIKVARLRCATTPAREQGETESGMFVQAFIVVDQRRDHRYIALGEFEGELVLFENRFVGPAQRTVKLGDQWLGVFDADLIDTVLVAVERQNTGVAEK